LKTFEKVLLLASLGLAAWGAYALILGFWSGVLCYQSHCAYRGSSSGGFVGYALVYFGMLAFGLASAWRSHRNLKTVWSKNDVAVRAPNQSSQRTASGGR